MKRSTSDPARPYDLPDAHLQASARGFEWLCFQPPRTCIVLGKGNRYEEEVLVDAIAADAVPVYRRPSGGHAVVLSPRMAVLALALGQSLVDASGHTIEPGTRTRLMPTPLFAWATGLLIAALERLDVRPITVQGTSDLTLGALKFCGSSVHLGARRSFFHAVINLAEDPALIARYLAMPPRQPAYRAARPHRDFVTSLARQGHPLSAADLERALARTIGERAARSALLPATWREDPS